MAPLGYLWIVGLVVTVGGSTVAPTDCSPCPAACACRALSAGACVVNCTGASLTAPPAPRQMPRHPNFVRDLILRDNNISSIAGGAFQSLEKLRKLDLSRNRLKSLEASSLDPLLNLTDVNLSLNPWLCCSRLIQLVSKLLSLETTTRLRLADEEKTLCLSESGEAVTRLMNLTYTLCPSEIYSCVSESRNRTMVPAAFKTVHRSGSLTECKQRCWQDKMTYALRKDSWLCFCGELTGVCSCQHNQSDCKQQYNVSETGAASVGVTIDLNVSHQTTYLMQHFTVSAGVSLDFVPLRCVLTYHWNLRNSGVLKTNTSKVSLFFGIPGSFNLEAKVIAESGANESAKLPLYIEVPISGLDIQCQKFIDVSHKLSIYLTLAQAYDVETVWFRTFNSSAKVLLGVCSKGWMPFKGRCLKLFKQHRATFTEALGNCSLQASELFGVDRWEDVQDLTGKHIGQFSKRLFFTGAKKHQNVYVCKNKTLLPSVLKHIQHKDKGECLLVGSHQLRGADCNSPRRYICQKDPVACPNGGQRYEGNGHCYFVMSDSKNWRQAEEICKQVNSYLVIIDTAALQSWITRTLLYQGSGINSVWIGLSDQIYEKRFIWSNKFPAKNFTHWSPAQTSKNEDFLDCVSMTNSSGDFYWGEDNCMRELPFVCEYSLAEKISTTSYTVGKHFLPRPVFPQVLISSSKHLSEASSVVTVLPGLQVGRRGTLRNWAFMHKPLRNSSRLHLQVYRPTCHSGLFLQLPGCTPVPPWYASCSNLSMPCKVQNRCPSSFQWCVLTNSCLPISESCNCYMARTMGLDCHVKLPDLQVDYVLVGETVLDVPAGGQSVYAAECHIDVEKGDVIGFQTLPANDIGICDSRNLTEPYQLVLEQNIVKGNLSSSNISFQQASKFRKVCHLQGVYIIPAFSHLPEFFSSADQPGEYSFQAVTKSAGEKASAGCSVIVQKKVERVVWVNPPINTLGTTPNSSGTVVVEYNVEFKLVIKVLQGSHLKVNWSLNDVPVTTSSFFQESCPADASWWPACHSRDADTEKPFAMKVLNLSINSGLKQIKVTVFNDISKEVIVVDVMKVIKISDLEILHSGSKQQVKVGSTVQFEAKVSRNTSLNYVWQINNTTIVHGKKMKHTFNHAGLFLVSIKVFNGVSSLLKKINITALQPAYIQNLRFRFLSNNWVNLVENNIVVTANSSSHAQVNVVCNFGDGSSPATNQTVVSNILHLSFSHTYSNLGVYILNVTVSDAFEMVSVHGKISVSCALFNVTIQTDKAIWPVNSSVEMDAVILSTCSDNVTYFWSVDNDTLVTSNSTIWQTFTEAGRYRVAVTVSIGIASVEAQAELSIQEGISGLLVIYNKYVYTEYPANITAMLDTGSHCTFSLYIINLDQNYEQKSKQFRIIFNQTGIYNILVNVSNNLNSEFENNITINAIERDVLVVGDIHPVACTSTDSQLNVSVNVSSYNISALVFSWNFGDGTKMESLGLQNTLHFYHSAGQYLITVKVGNQVEQHERTLSVCIEEAIRGLLIKSANVVAIYFGRAVTETAMATVTNGSNVAYLWSLESGVVTAESAVHNVTFNQPGLHFLNVTAFNNVSTAQFIKTIQVEEVIERLSIFLSNYTCEIRYQETNTMASFAAVLHRGTNVTFVWDMGYNSNVISTENVSMSHVYAQPGQYEVVLTAFNLVTELNKTCLLTVEDCIKDLQISANASNVLIGGAVEFTASVSSGTSLIYDFRICGESVGTHGNKMNTTVYVFNSTGICNCSVRVGNHLGYKEAFITVFVMRRIVLGIQTNLMHGWYAAKGETWILKPILAEKTPETKYRWSVTLSSNVLVNSTAETLTFKPSRLGIYMVDLSAQNPFPKLYCKKKKIEVEEKIHGLRLYSNDSVKAVNSKVTFYALVTRGSNISYRWQVSGPTAGASGVQVPLAALANLTETFSAAGNYAVLINASNHISSSAAVLSVTIQQEVRGVSFRLPRAVATNQTADLEAVAREGTDIRYRWAVVGGGALAQVFRGRNVSYLFPRSGHYLISVRASNDVSSSSARGAVLVQDPITLLELAAAPKGAVRTGRYLHLSVSRHTGSGVSFTWDFGDAHTVYGAGSTRVRHSYSSPGARRVTVLARNEVSAMNASARVRVQDPVSGSRVVGCERVWVASRPVSLTASARGGTDPFYRWRLGALVLRGPSFYRKLPPGAHALRLRVWNRVSGEAVGCTLRVEGEIRNLRLEVAPGAGGRLLLANRTVRFEASGDNLRPALFVWTVTRNDSGATSAVYATRRGVLSTAFPSRGGHCVGVNASNAVSSAASAVCVEVVGCDPPAVSLAGGASRVALRSKPVAFTADIGGRGCGAHVAQYRWTVYQEGCHGNPLNSAVGLPSGVFVRSPQLSIPPWTLPYGTYCVVFGMDYRQTPVTGRARGDLTVVASPLMAVIEGGSSLMAPVDETLVLNGSQSYDPDLPRMMATPLSYSWTCGILPQGVSRTSPRCFSAQQTAVVTLQPFTLSFGVHYIINLTVAAQGRIGDSVTQVILIMEKSIPVINIECLSCLTLDSYMVSSGHHVTLRAYCRNCARTEQLDYFWEVWQDSKVRFTLDGITTTTGARSSNLVIRKGFLIHKHAYTFVVHAKSLKTNLSSQANLSMQANIPPVHGTCTVYPTSVISLQTPVNITCSDWIDPDSSMKSMLIFDISMESYHPESYLLQSINLYRGILSSHQLFLAPWPGSKRSNYVNIIVHVEDLFGARTCALNRSVQTISPGAGSNQTKTTFLAERAMADLVALAKQNNPVSLLQYAVALLMELNDESERATSLKNDSEWKTRSAIRNAVTVALVGLPLSSKGDARLLASALEQITVFTSEYQTYHCHVLTLQAVHSITKAFESAHSLGLYRDDFPTYSLISTMYNLIQAVMLGMHSDSSLFPSSGMISPLRISAAQLKPEISDTITFLQSDMTAEQHQKYIVSEGMKTIEYIISSVLMTLVADEEPVVVQLKEMLISGKRSLVKKLSQFIELENCYFKLPADLFSHHLANLSGSTEVFEIASVLPRNPFTWNYLNNAEITSQVPLLTFKYVNGSEISVSNLKPNKAIKMIICESNNIRQPSSGWNFSKSTYQQLQKLKVKSITLDPLSRTEVTINTSDIAVRSSMHIQVRFTLVPNSTDKAQNVTPQGLIRCFLGAGYVPNSNKFDAKKTISSKDMAVRRQHTAYTIFINSRSFHPAETYHLNIFSNNDHHQANVTVGIYFSSCQYFNVTAFSWMSNGCTSLAESTVFCTVCQCDHLTAFGARMLMSPESIDFSDLIKLNLSSNPVAMITCVMIALAYIVLAVICYRFDVLERQRVASVPLCGKDGSYKYKVTVITGRQHGAGTTACVGIKLYGKQGKISSRHLSKLNAFRRNSCDTFLITHDTYVGELQRLLVWHDNSGLSPSWYLSQIIIKDLLTDKNYFFYANIWLSLEVDKGTIQKELLVADPKELTRFSRLFWAAVFNCLAEKHIWLSVVNRPVHSLFSRFQRLTCCVTFLYVFMCINVMWYGAIKGSVINVRPWNSWDIFSWEELIVGIASNIMVFPINLGIVCLFRKSKPKSKEMLSNCKPPPAESIEMEAWCDMPHCSSSFTSKSPHDGAMERGSSKECVQVKEELRRTCTVPRIHRKDSEGSLSRGCSEGQAFIEETDLKRLPRCGTQMMWSNDSILDSWPNSLPLWREESISSVNSETAKMMEQTQQEGIGIRIPETKVNSTLPNDSSRCAGQDAVRQRWKTGNSSVSVGNMPGTSGLSTEGRVQGSTSSTSFTTEDRQSSRKPMAALLSKRSQNKIPFTERAKAARTARKHFLPHWCCYISYILCLLLSAISAVVVILYGQSFGPQIAIRWLLAFLLSFFYSLLLMEPLKVLLIALYMSVIMKKDQDDEESILDPLPAADRHHGQTKEVKFKPLGGYALLQAKEYGEKVRRMHAMIQDVVALMLFIWLVSIVCYIHYSSQNYRFMKFVEDEYIKQTKNQQKGFFDIICIADFWNWSKTVLAAKLFPSQSSDTAVPFLISGTARLRQVRSLPCDCLAGKYVDTMYAHNSSHLCDGQEDFVEDTAPLRRDNNTFWQYRDAEQLHVPGQFGATGHWYGGGGYAQDLGKSLNDTLDILQRHQDENWLDERTRALFVEFALLSSNTDLVVVICCLIEFPLTGGSFQSSSIEVHKFQTYSMGQMDSFLVLEGIFLLFVLYLIIQLLKKICKQRSMYFREFWNWIEMITTLTAAASIALYIHCLVHTTLILRHYQNNSQQVYMSFAQAAHLHTVWKQINALLLYFIMLKKTLSHGIYTLASCCLIFLLLFCVYAQFGYLLYGRKVSGFKSFGTSLFFLAGVLRGREDLRRLLPSSPNILTSLYIYTFKMAVTGLTGALIAIVLIDALKRTRSQMYYKASLDLHDYEMIDFIIKRFKIWAGIKKPKAAFRRVKFEGLPSLTESSTCSSSSNYTSTNTSSQSSDLLSSGSQQIDQLLDRVQPVWQAVLQRFDQLERLDQEEEKACNKLHKRIDDWKWEMKIAKLEKEEILLRTTNQRQQHKVALKKPQGFFSKERSRNNQVGVAPLPPSGFTEASRNQ